ncbi:MAG: hypothetical protein AVDCRST_MAG73-2034 [uncultured Thermomicrobiales bacterium]|uniref:Uncharacterized protein n=1 Tax=uncultured Thermomicrobiales bacterium TaxID=1645740 RepID=A0A6J4U8S9_9BACT|nr:MAG: hypothetical protein AVDCRST_MAG73-2034 [uncultured Thermomicrobiales bacterium]
MRRRPARITGGATPRCLPGTRHRSGAGVMGGSLPAQRPGNGGSGRSEE